MKNHPPSDSGRVQLWLDTCMVGYTKVLSGRFPMMSRDELLAAITSAEKASAACPGQRDKMTFHGAILALKELLTKIEAK